MKKILTLLAALSLCVASMASAADRVPPTAAQDQNGNIALASNAAQPATTTAPGTNIYKYEGSPSTFDVPLSIHKVPATAFRQPDGKYTIALFANPEEGNIFCGGQDGGQMIEDMNKMHRYAPSLGYKYTYYLGNLTGPQRKKMPVGELDLANHRVIFRDVELKPGMKDVRLNMPVKIVGPDGKELKAPDPNGFYGWLTDDPDKSVIGTPDNGFYFDVLEDGTIQAKGLDFRKPS